MKLNIQQILEALTTYFSVNCQVGHTTLLKKGLDNYDQDKFIVVFTKSQGVELCFNNNDTVSLGNLEQLRGHQRPMVIEDGTLNYILSKALEEIQRLEKENLELRVNKGIVENHIKSAINILQNVEKNHS